jgi:hypothetical protein
MLSVFLEIIFNWIIMGMVLATVMAGCLYFAILCEKIVDYLFSH